MIKSDSSMILALGLDPRVSEIPIPGERRAEYRRSVELAGVCQTHEGDSAVDCRIKDVTSSGAQLELDDTDKLPDKFKLYISGLNIALICQVVWRTQSRVGVSLESM